jgi:hypothetical protein
VAELKISPRTAEKIQSKHGLHPDDIRAVVVGQSGLHYSWSFDPERGRRALVKVRIQGRLMLLVLYPRTGYDPHSFNLGSAYLIGVAR